ncbi:hypothetical protein SAY86_008165 [Trapa natans]|uniref:PUM-HD domain-containing protein n=1 Tax=Trapa natans TaxID=22666 RepID=A0AAN7KES2_TRANT|nr:hypothetical protein SAY86_008165 [Trapa natans]
MAEQGKLKQLEQRLNMLTRPIYMGNFPTMASMNQQSDEFIPNRQTSLEVQSNFKITNRGFQQNLFEGYLPEEITWPDEQLLISEFADWNLGSIPEQQGGILFSADGQSGDPPASNMPNGGAKTMLQNTENYCHPPWLMNDGMGFVSDPSFPADTQPSPPNSRPQHVNINQSQFMWRTAEEERLYKTLEQRNICLVQQHIHEYNSPNLYPANSNMTYRLMNQNQGHNFQNHKIHPWVVDSPGLHLPDEHLTSMEVLNKFSEGSCSRIQQANPSFRGVDQNTRFLPNNDQVCYNSCHSDHGFFSLGNLRTAIDLSPNRNGLRGSDVELLPLEYGCVDEVRGFIYRLATDQNGCRYLQRKFLEGGPHEVAIIFKEILKHISDLMTDQFGNYVVQKLLQVCDENQLSQILQKITQRPGNLIRVSCDLRGTRAVQTVLQSLGTPEQFSMAVASLKLGMVTLMKNINGHHVVKCCFEHLAPKYYEFIFEVAAKNCIDLAIDRHGCCVLQKCLSHPGGEQRICLIFEIATNSHFISQSEFGNYLVQYVLRKIPEAIPDVLDRLEGHYVDLSMQKYSSNVIEKCIEYASEERQRRIIWELITSPLFHQVMQDPYGNYVIQVALKSSKGEIKEAMVEAIKPHVHVLRCSPYGKKVLSSICLKNLPWFHQERRAHGIHKLGVI